MDLGGYNILNSNLLISNQNQNYQLTISAPVNVNYGIDIMPGWESYNALQNGTLNVSRFNYIRFNYGRQWNISAIDDTGLLTGDSLIFRCGASSLDLAKLILNYSSITTPLPINGVSQLQMSYLSNITSDVQTQLNNCVMFGDLSFNNN